MTRYWVGGSGNWNDAATHWASISNGSPSVGNLPTSVDDVVIDSNSGLSGGTISLNGAYYSAVCHDFTSTTGFNYTIDYVSSDFSIFGSAVFESGLTWYTGTWTYFASNSTGETIQLNGCTIYYISFGDQQGVGNGDTGEWTILDNLSVTNIFYQETGSVITNGDITIGSDFNLFGGTFDANDKNITVVDSTIEAEAGITTTLNMGSGIWEVTVGGWSVFESGGGSVVINAETSKLLFSAYPSFYGGGKVYYDIEFQLDANLYNNFTVHDLTLTAGKFYVFEDEKTVTFTGNLVAIGSVGNLIELFSSSTGTQFIFSKPSGIVDCDYLDISDSNATGGASWYAGIHSEDTTNNDGWIWGSPGSISVFDSVTLSQSVTVLKNLQINVSDNINASEIHFVDGHSESNLDTSYDLYHGQNIEIGQAFTSNGGTLDHIIFYISKYGTPPGSVCARLYAETHATGYGIDSKPTGSVLATSDTITATDLDTSFGLVTFNFSGANRIGLENGSYYVATLYYDNGDSLNRVQMGGDGISPSHEGNGSKYISSWTQQNTDFIFYVYKDSISISILGGGLTIDVFDSITATENILAIKGNLAINIFDSVAVSENITVQEAQYKVNLSDSLAVSENLTILEAQYKVNIYDLVSVSENISAIRALSISVSDNISVSENINTVIPQELSVFDSVLVSENLSIGTDKLIINVFDGVSISESISIYPANLPISVDDSVLISDPIEFRIVLEGWTFDEIEHNIWTKESETALTGWTEETAAPETPATSWLLDTGEIVLGPILYRAGDIEMYEQFLVSEYLSINAAYPIESTYDSLSVSESVSMQKVNTTKVVADTIGVSESVTLAIA